MKIEQLVRENNLNCFEEKVRNEFWDMLDENNGDRAHDKFYNHFQHLYNEALPVKNKKIKLYDNIYKPWLTHGILNSVYVKSWLYNFFKLKLWSRNKNILTLKIY